MSGRSCKYFQRGQCTRGDECRFSHDVTPNAQTLCQFFAKGKCSRDNCAFSHDPNAPRAVNTNQKKCRDFQQGSCSRNDCKFSHETTSSRKRGAPSSFFEEEPEPEPVKKKAKLVKKATSSKNRPIEMSATKPVKRYAPILSIAKKHTKRDPRFDPHSGELNENAYHQAYGFINEYKQDEIKILEKTKRKLKNKTKKAEVSSAIKEMKREHKFAVESDRKRSLVSEWKKEEFAARAAGKKPFFLKASEQKKLVLADRYLQMKKVGNVKKIIEKKRKRNAQKDRKWLPKREE